MVLVMLQCSVVGKWTGGAVGAGNGKLIGDYKVWGVILAWTPASREADQSQSLKAAHSRVPARTSQAVIMRWRGSVDLPEAVTKTAPIRVVGEDRETNFPTKSSSGVPGRTN